MGIREQFITLQTDHTDMQVVKIYQLSCVKAVCNAAFAALKKTKGAAQKIKSLCSYNDDAVPRASEQLVTKDKNVVQSTSFQPMGGIYSPLLSFFFLLMLLDTICGVSQIAALVTCGLGCGARSAQSVTAVPAQSFTGEHIF